MNFDAFSDIYHAVFSKNRLDAYQTDDMIRQFFRLTELMLETNQHMNVTAITDIEKIIPLHYADCLLAAACIPTGATVLDVGCGGGFPILPLAIARPDLHLAGLDSTEKKLRYVADTAKALSLPLSVLPGRAEDLSRAKEHRETYDIVISRAVARLQVLDELCLPFVSRGGMFIAMKGALGRQEIEEAANGITRLGGSVEEIISTELFTCDGPEERVMALIRKTANTPSAYPRAFGAIKKKPL